MTSKLANRSAAVSPPFGEKVQDEPRLVGSASTFLTSPRPRTETDVPPSHPEARVLIAEDNSVNRKVALGQLRKLGYSADAVANGLEAVQAAERIPYDIILMDCQMPEMDGYEATRQIRRRERAPEHGRAPCAHIIALTADALEGAREKCLAAGMDDHMTKPLRLHELRQTLERLSPAVANAAVPKSSSGGHCHCQVEKTMCVSREPLRPAPAPDLEDIPFDPERLLEAVGGSGDTAREILELYVGQAHEILRLLSSAIENSSTPDIARLAHKLVGASATCGITSMVVPLRQLEQLSRAGQLPRARAEYLHIAARRQFERVRSFLNGYYTCLEHTGPPV